MLLKSWFFALIKSIIFLIIALYFLFGRLSISPSYSGIIGVFFLSLAIREFLIFLVNVTAPRGRLPKREKYFRKSISYFFTAILFGFEGYMFWRHSKFLATLIPLRFLNLFLIFFVAIASISLVLSFVYFIRAIIKK